MHAPCGAHVVPVCALHTNTPVGMLCPCPPLPSAPPTPSQDHQSAGPSTAQAVVLPLQCARCA
eukprot:597588-Pelagomonas_calceolata.AAC.4